MKKLFSAIVLGAGFVGTGASASTITYDNGGTTSGLWSLAPNWVGDVLPGSGDAVLLDNSAVTLPSTFSLGAAFTIQTLTLNSGASNILQTNASGTTGRTLTLNGNGSGTADLVSVIGSSTLTIQSTNGTLSLALGDSGKLNVASGSTLDIATVISGAKSLEKTGAGDLTLRATNTFTGGFTATGGTTRLGAGAGAGAASGTVTLNGGTVSGYLASSITMAASPIVVAANSSLNADRSTAGAGVTYTFGNLSIGNFTLNTTSGSNVTSGTGGVTLGTVTLTGNATFNVTNGAAAATTLTLGAIGETGGARSLTKTGDGALSLGGASTATGGVTVNAGTLNINNNAALGTGTLVINGGTLNVSAARTTTNNNAMTWNGNFGFAGGNTLDLGTGAVAISTPLTVTVSASTLTFGGAISSGSIFDLGKAGAGTLVYSGNIALSGAQTLSGISAGTETLNGVISGAGSLGLNSAGALALGGTNTFTNGVTLTAGTLNLNNDAALGTGTFTINGGTVNVNAARVTTNNNAEAWNGDFTFAGSNTWNTGTGAVTLGGNRTVTVSASTMTVGGAVGDSGSAFGLTKAGVGTLVLNGNNTYTGLTTVSGGTLTLGGANSGAGGVTLSGGTLNLVNSAALGSGVLTINTGSSIGASGGATLNLSGNNAMNWNGSFSTAGTQALGLGNGAVTLAGPLTVTAVRSLTFGGLISGGTIFDITKAGTSNLTYTNSTATNISGGVTLNTNAGIFYIDNKISGTGGLTIAGAGVAVFGGTNSGASDFTGDVNITGTLNNYDNGSAALFLPNGTRTGDVNLSGSLQLVNGQTINGLNGAGLVTYGHSGSAIFTLGDNNANGLFSGTIATQLNFNTISLVKIGGGTQQLTGAGSYYGGTTTVRGGVLQVSSLGIQTATAGTTASSIGSSTNAASNLILNGGTLSYVGAAATTDRLFQVGVSTTGAIGTLDASGTGAINFSNTGSIAYGTAGTTGAAQTRTLALSGSNTDDNTLAAVIGNNGVATNGNSAVSVAKSGSGKWILTGANTYTGATTVSGGTLLINGSLAAGSAVNVASGATLGGSGTINGATTITNGTLSPGNSPGVLTFGDNLTLSGNSTNSLFEVASGTRGTNYDGVTLSNGASTLTYDGTLTLSIAASLANSTYDLFAFTGPDAGDFDSLVFSGGFYSGSFANASGIWTAFAGGQQFVFTESTGDLVVSAVPEPSTYALLGLGLGALYFLRRKRGNV